MHTVSTQHSTLTSKAKIEHSKHNNIAVSNPNPNPNPYAKLTLTKS